jgi:hypothetical protein
MSSDYSWDVVSRSQSRVVDDTSDGTPDNIQATNKPRSPEILRIVAESRITDSDRASVCRIMFNAPFYRSVGFYTKRAADTLVSSLSCIHDMYLHAVDNVIEVIARNRDMVRAFLLTEHEQDIFAANAKDKKVSEDIKQARIRKHIEQEYHEARARRTEGQEQQLLNLEQRLGRANISQDDDSEQQLLDLEQRLEQANISQDDDSKRHFCEIEMICKSDPQNSISVQVLSYMRNNRLV